ncbi:SDR family NAD(P)-dependent oxidoreductase [Macrococcus equipercicus]|uniref:SDR family NAD(P)-dependent oxidoreductase n=1 Tax=Macrococcus equipercicus TaxID=69967 RepID=A0ABQ6R8U3_9STAP|nr:SDR family NAD(P)-dependent oxidoreductase [Macrococcus equipercicus]KAA1039547.1 SDR family NAD(P)-dependent oxidoreductase [Macrococcus equipercicus]
MRVVFITGGNKGLGYEAAKQLVTKGYKVYIGSRDLVRGKETAQTIGAYAIQVDVTDEISVQKAADRLNQIEGKVDILINNAGISGGFNPPRDITVETMTAVYNTNVFGIVRMMRHFIPLLEQSAQPVVVNVSSGLGSFDMVTNPETMESKVNSLAYCSSKSAVNMLTLQYAKGLPHIQINSADPGATNTDLVGDASNNAKPASEGIIPIIRLATIDANGPTGTFENQHGTMSW